MKSPKAEPHASRILAAGKSIRSKYDDIIMILSRCKSALRLSTDAVIITNTVTLHCYFKKAYFTMLLPALRLYRL